MLSNREEYDLYLASEHWKRTRAEAHERAGHECEKCFAPDKLDVHHLTYDRIGHELPSDLMVLCRACHQEWHDENRLVNWKFAKRMSRAEIIAYVPDYEAGVEYTERDLERLADKMIIQDVEGDGRASVLLEEQLRLRRMREIYVESGTPDPGIEEGLYWRTHPEGRAWWSYKDRHEGGPGEKRGFYRNASARNMGRDYEWHPEPFKPLLENSRPKKTLVMGGGSLRSSKLESRRKSACKRRQRQKLTTPG